MKLLLCTKCGDVFKLTAETLRSCRCGTCSGKVKRNDIDVFVHGPRDSTFVLGFANTSLIAALMAQRHEGDLPKTMRYGGRFVSPGREFDAFVIPAGAESVEWRDESTP
jgi:hypothetical protein